MEKFISSFGIILICCSVLAFSEEATAAPAAGSEPAPLLLQRAWFSSQPIGKFQLSDGTLITDGDALARMAQCPENQAVLAGYAGWSIAANVSGCIFAGIAGAVPSLAKMGIIPADIAELCVPVAVVSAFTAMISYNLAHDNKTLAMQNYNLYIMGIPIPHK
jgi:hypothetical protein